MKDTRELLRSAAETIRELRLANESLRRTHNEPIAVVGLGCRFPGSIHGASDLWNVVSNGIDTITEIPSSRWDADAYFDPDPACRGKTNSRWGGFIDDIDKIDREFFGFSAREASRMDPQHRVFLEVAWESIEDAGLTVAALARAKTGIFLGISGYDYYHLQMHDADMYTATGNGHSFAGARLAHLLDLHGPNMPVDTACSSSLVAIHLACASLRSRDSDIALAGGVNLQLTPETSAVISKTCALSTDGRCRSFDAGAAGFVRSEGCGVVVLKRLAAAVADRDPIRAVILGSAINHDGRAAGITAPNGIAQEQVLRQALDSAGLKASDVTYIEAHGSGTPLGDAIELEALKAVYGPASEGGTSCALGCVKSNLGHLEAAAGIAGLIKTVVAMERGKLPGVLHFERLNPKTRLDGTRLFIPREPVSWNGPRIAAVSSFGFSGTNAHVLMSAPPAPAQRSPGDIELPLLLPLSARSERALRVMAAKWEPWLRDEPPDLVDIAYTAGNRRTHHRWRLAVLGWSAAQWADGLESWLRSKPSDFVFSSTAASPVPRATGTRESQLRKSALLYVKGGDVQWSEVQPDGSHVALPCYPWQRERFWIDLPPPAIEARPDAHPLLGEEIKLAAQPLTRCWQSKITAQAPAYFNDHELDGKPLVPAAAHLEIALAASGEVFPAGPRELTNVQFHAPLFLAPDAVYQLQVWMELQAGGGADFRIFARLDDAGHAIPWRLVASGRAASNTGKASRIDTELLRARCGFAVSPSGLYERLAERGIALGPAFRRLNDVRRGDGEAFSSLSPAEEPEPAYLVHPVCLDACFQNLAAALNAGAQGGGTFLPIMVERLVFYGRGTPVHVSGRLNTSSEEARGEVAGQAQLIGATGEVIVSMEGVRIRAIESSAATALQYALRWWRVEDSAESEPANWLVMSKDEARGRALERELRNEIAARAHVVFVATEDDGADPASSGEEACNRLTALLQQLAARTPAPRLTIVTQHAQMVEGDHMVSPGRAMLWGLGRVAANEHPELDCRLIDIARDTSPRELASVLARRTQPQLALRNGASFAPRLSRLSGSPKMRMHIRSDATYLITGGTGGLGLEVADRLAQRGASHLVLLARKDPDERVRRRIEAIEARGVRVLVRCGDSSDPEALQQILADIRDSLPPLRGVVHAAGVVRDALIINQTPDLLHAVTEGKARGAWLLHCALERTELDFFILFSSLSGVLGRPTQSNYAAASAFLDALALHRQQLGRPALAIDWGPWAEVGMATTSLASSSAAGIEGLENETALDALESLAISGIAHAAVAAIDPERLSRALRWPAILDEIAHPFVQPRDARLVGPDAVVLIQRYLLDHLAPMLGAEPESLSADLPINDLGLDSLMTLDLREAIVNDFGVTLPLVQLLKGLSIVELALEVAAKGTPPVERTEAEWQTLRI